MIKYELYIKGKQIDLDSDVVFPLTFSQADAKNPEKRKRNASKTIVVPGTNHNNEFFGAAWDLAITDVY